MGPSRPPLKHPAGSAGVQAPAENGQLDILNLSPAEATGVHSEQPIANWRWSGILTELATALVRQHMW